MTDSASVAFRLAVDGGARSAERMAGIANRARELGVMGWVRSRESSALEVHAEGEVEAVRTLLAFLGASAPADRGGQARATPVRVEGHEQFGLRGVSAGTFVVTEHQATAHHFDLRLEVDGVMRSWAVPKGPSLDPVVKRLAVQVPDHAVGGGSFEGRSGSGGVIVWDRGTYEQGGRVAWPEALDRGHAVFALHGCKLRGGFALQRTGSGPKAQWLLIKRRDDDARPGSDIVAEQPRSVLGGLTLAEVIGG